MFDHSGKLKCVRKDFISQDSLVEGNHKTIYQFMSPAIVIMTWLAISNGRGAQ